MIKVISIIFIFSPIYAFGCSCINEADTFEEELSQYKAIFTGVVQSVEKTDGDRENSIYKTTVSVGKVWKGKQLSKNVVIATSTELSSCGSEPQKVGNELLIFTRLIKNEIFFTGGCSPLIDLTKGSDISNPISKEFTEYWNKTFEDLQSILGDPTEFQR